MKFLVIAEFYKRYKKLIIAIFCSIFFLVIFYWTKGVGGWKVYFIDFSKTSKGEQWEN